MAIATKKENHHDSRSSKTNDHPRHAQKQPFRACLLRSAPRALPRAGERRRNAPRGTDSAGGCRARAKARACRQAKEKTPALAPLLRRSSQRLPCHRTAFPPARAMKSRLTSVENYGIIKQAKTEDQPPGDFAGSGVAKPMGVPFACFFARIFSRLL